MFLKLKLLGAPGLTERSNVRYERSYKRALLARTNRPGLCGDIGATGGPASWSYEPRSCAAAVPLGAVQRFVVRFTARFITAKSCSSCSTQAILGVVLILHNTWQFARSTHGSRLAVRSLSSAPSSLPPHLNEILRTCGDDSHHHHRTQRMSQKESMIG